MQEPDELFTVRNYFWLGNYQMAVMEGQVLTNLPESLRVQRDVYIHRAQIGLNQHNLVIDSVPVSAPVDLQAVKLLATYLSPAPQHRDKEIVFITLNDWLNDTNTANNPTLQLIAGIIYCNEGKFAEALKAVKNGTKLEMMALTVQLLLRLDRLDLAEAELKKMQAADDESTITQLAAAWVYLAQGGAKYKEAAYLFQELGERFGQSSKLLNGLAVANMHLRNYEDALRYLVDAAGKNPEDADTLVNLIVCSSHLRKPQELVQKYLSQLQTVAPQHSFLATYSSLSSAFDRVAATFG